MIGIPVGLMVSNISEWVIHKYVLHGRGRDRNSFWAFHYHDHHKEARKADFVDEAYSRTLLGWNAQSKEALALAAVTAIQLPLFPIAPFYVGTMVYTTVNYYRVHKKAHLDSEWAKAHVPWHWDHHMGPNQDANWCVTRPWFDHIMGTREPYLGTELEARNTAKRAALRSRMKHGERRRAAS